jgi:hypothetical protein
MKTRRQGEYEMRQVSMHVCYITYKYTVKGKTYYMESMRDTTKQYTEGDTFDVFYESKNPTNIAFQNDDYRVLGVVLSVIMCMILMGLGVRFFLTSKVKG